MVGLSSRINCFHSFLAEVVFYKLLCVRVHKWHIPFRCIHNSNLRSYLQHRGCINIMQTLWREGLSPMWVQIQRCWECQALFGGVCVSCVSLGTLKLSIMPLLKFMFLKYWYEGGGRANQTLVKVIFQWK